IAGRVNTIMSDKIAQWAAQVQRLDAGRSFLPPEQPLDMPAQDFDVRPQPTVRGDASVHWTTRAALFAGVILLIIGFARELYLVLSFVQITPVQIVFLILSTLAFA